MSKERSEADWMVVSWVCTHNRKKADESPSMNTPYLQRAAATRVEEVKVG